MPKAKDLTNQQNLHFQTDAIINGGESMRGGKSLEVQIAEAPESVLWKPIMDWGKYKTSVVDQLVFTAEALDRIEARQHAQQSVLDQIAAAASKGVPVVIDYDEIEKRIAANMPTYVPQVKEGEN